MRTAGAACTIRKGLPRAASSPDRRPGSQRYEVSSRTSGYSSHAHDPALRGPMRRASSPSRRAVAREHGLRERWLRLPAAQPASAASWVTAGGACPYNGRSPAMLATAGGVRVACANAPVFSSTPHRRRKPTIDSCLAPESNAPGFSPRASKHATRRPALAQAVGRRRRQPRGPKHSVTHASDRIARQVRLASPLAQQRRVSPHVLRRDFAARRVVTDETAARGHAGATPSA